MEHSILFNIRLPHILLGIAVGGSLSLSGVILQGMFRNPLTEPYTLGIAGGAVLGVSINIVFRLGNVFGFIIFPISGFLGALLVIILIYVFNIRKGIVKIQGLLLTGVMMSFISSSLNMLIMSIARTEDLQGIIHWTMGSLSESNWTLILIILSVSILGLILSSFFSLDLNAFGMGEEEAIHIGINTSRTKKILFILVSILVGLSVSVGGIIGFVGLIVPHFMRLSVGGDHRILLVSSFLSGAAFLILCDMIARIIISPLELPVGVITGIIGGILFITAINRKKAEI